MRTTTPLGWGLAAVAAVGLAGCCGAGALNRQAEQTYQRVAAAAPATLGAERGTRNAERKTEPVAVSSAIRVPSSEFEGREAVPRQVLFFAPHMEPSPLDPVPPLAAADAKSPAGPTTAGAAAAAEEKAPKVPEFAPLPGETFGQVVKSDLLAAPGKIWSGTKDTFGNVENLAVLSVAFGADRIVRHNLDERIHEQRERHHFPALQTGDFGTIAGNPALHFGGALAWYAISVDRRDEKNYALAKTLIEALAINDLTTGFLQVSVHERAPNGEYFGWPSGHTSSSFTVAAVMHQYYGWQVGIPSYLLAGYLAATRVEDREHNVSDLVFGAAMGLVIGHSVAKGELPQLAGFDVLPYGGNGVGGLMFVKQW